MRTGHIQKTICKSKQSKRCIIKIIQLNKGEYSKLLFPSFEKRLYETGVYIPELEYKTANKGKYVQEKINPKRTNNPRAN